MTETSKSTLQVLEETKADMIKRLHDRITHPAIGIDRAPAPWWKSRRPGAKFVAEIKVGYGSDEGTSR